MRLTSERLKPLWLRVETAHPVIRALVRRFVFTFSAALAGISAAALIHHFLAVPR
jgi:hypothetical protein